MWLPEKVIKHKVLESLLERVEKPARYTGGEWNICLKESADVRFAFAFPDTLEAAGLE